MLEFGPVLGIIWIAVGSFVVASAIITRTMWQSMFSADRFS